MLKGKSSYNFLKCPYKQIKKAFEVKIWTAKALKYGSRKV